MQSCDRRTEHARVRQFSPQAGIDRQLPIGEEIFLDHVGHFVRDPEAASRALMRAGFAPAPVSIQVNPDPGGGAPHLTGTGNVTAMFMRGYIEALFKTADTALGRELDAGLARYPGVHLAAFAVADAAAAHARLAAQAFACGRSWRCNGRSIPAVRPEPRPSRWRASSPARCRRAASKFSPIAPSTWCGSRAGLRIRTARSA